MITMMLSGTLARQPEQRTSKDGNAFAVATVRAQTPEGDIYASVTAWSDLADTLADLGDPGGGFSRTAEHCQQQGNRIQHSTSHQHTLVADALCLGSRTIPDALAWRADITAGYRACVMR